VTYTEEEIAVTLNEVDKIDRALGEVRNLSESDAEMDDFAKEAMNAFHDLMDIGRSVDDRFAAGYFDAANKMITSAMAAKNAKVDKKIKMIQLQLSKAKVDLDNRKLDIAAQKNLPPSDDGFGVLEGEGNMVIDRNEIIASLLKQFKEEQNKDAS
jgi:hypothetical protein